MSLLEHRIQRQDPGCDPEPPAQEKRKTNLRRSKRLSKRRKLLCERGEPMDFTQENYDFALYTSMLSSRKNSGSPLPTNEWDRLILNGANLDSYARLLLPNLLATAQIIGDPVDIFKYMIDQAGWIPKPSFLEGDPAHIIKYMLEQAGFVPKPGFQIRAADCGAFETVRVLCTVGGMDPALLLHGKSAGVRPLPIEAIQIGLELGADPNRMRRAYGVVRSPLKRILSYGRNAFPEHAKLLISNGAVPQEADELDQSEQDSYDFYKTVVEREEAEIIAEYPNAERAELLTPDVFLAMFDYCDWLRPPRQQE